MAGVRLLVGGLICLCLAACDPVGSPTQLASANSPSATQSLSPVAERSPSPSQSHVVPVTAGSAAAALAHLSVKGRAPLTGYSREAFGTAWYDANGNGCDTRDDVLRRQLTQVRSAGCEVLSGTIVDPYTGARIRFARDGTLSQELDIDHVVALGDAWQSGAAYWPFRKRVAFANDPTNLLAVDASENRQKGDSNAASWLPPNKAYRCAYVARQITVKQGYGLWVTAAEKAAMARVLAACPGQRLAGAVHLIVVGSPTPGTSPDQTSSPLPLVGTGGSGGKGGLDPRFSTCKLAKAHGYGPYRRGKDPEYAWYRDADHDGIVCE